MCCSGIVRLHATLAEGTFLLLRESYDIFGNDGFLPENFISEFVLAEEFSAIGCYFIP